MNLKRFAIPALAVFLGSTCASMAWASGAAQGPPPPGYHDHDHDHGGWDMPPREFNDLQRRGFHDGIEGARKDFENHRRPDVNNRDEYRHSDLRRGDRRMYREAFRRGYHVGVRHFYGGDRR
ncbi:MAG TPA: hypothetical protein VND90_09015 [Terracidiphilus sp.]|nr:hypothetical protein [Terracidiphilus sp.]